MRLISSSVALGGDSAGAAAQALSSVPNNVATMDRPAVVFNVESSVNG